MHHLDVVSNIDILVLGSSRAILISSDMVGGMTHLYNASMLNAGIQDYAVVWQFLKNKNKLPRYLLLYLDQWAFNKSSETEHWLGHLAHYEQFRGRDYAIRDRVMLRAKKLLRTLSEITDLMSWPVIKDSLKILFSSNTPRIVKVTDMPSEESGKRSDGSHIFPASYNKDLTREELRERVFTSLDQCPLYLCDWRFDEQAYEDLKKLLKEAGGVGVKTLLVFPPIHPLMLSKLKNSVEYDPLLKEATEKVGGDLLRDPELTFTFCDASDPDTIPCSETDFTDDVHAKTACVERTLRKCVEGFALELIPHRIAAY